MISNAISLFAAGSLKPVFTEMIGDYQTQSNIDIKAKFSPSGLLREAIENGEVTDIFASANMQHPNTLLAQGWGVSVTPFARNKLCAIAQSSIKIDEQNFLTVLLDNNIRLGTSTPLADPSGDYAWALFEKAEKIAKGSFNTLSLKALQLTGGKDAEKAPEGKNQYAWIMEKNKADVFLTYCTNALIVKQQIDNIQVIQIPESLSVGADYGLIINKVSSKEAQQFVVFILSPSGRSILQKYGFETTLHNKNMPLQK